MHLFMVYYHILAGVAVFITPVLFQDFCIFQSKPFNLPFFNCLTVKCEHAACSINRRHKRISDKNQRMKKTAAKPSFAEMYIGLSRCQSAHVLTAHNMFPLFGQSFRGV